MLIKIWKLQIPHVYIYDALNQKWNKILSHTFLNNEEKLLQQQVMLRKYHTQVENRIQKQMICLHVILAYHP